jgi:hypothetical protein
MEELKAQDACEAVYEKHGAERYGKCRAAGMSCKDDKECDKIFLEYAKRLEDVFYKGSFEEYKKVTPATKAGLSKTTKIGIAIGAVAVIGVVIYFATRKK